MIYLRKIFSLVLIFLLNGKIFSQDIDALLSKSEKFLETKPDSSLKYAFLAEEQSQKKNDITQMAKAFLAIGNAFDKTESLDNEIFYFKKAVECIKNSEDEKLKAKIYLSLGEAYFGKGNYDEAFLNFRKAQITGGKFNDKELLYGVYWGLGGIYIYEEKRNLDSAENYFN